MLYAELCDSTQTQLMNALIPEANGELRKKGNRWSCQQFAEPNCFDNEQHFLVNLRIKELTIQENGLYLWCLTRLIKDFFLVGKEIRAIHFIEDFDMDELNIDLMGDMPETQFIAYMFTVCPCAFKFTAYIYAKLNTHSPNLYSIVGDKQIEQFAENQLNSGHALTVTEEELKLRKIKL